MYIIGWGRVYKFKFQKPKLKEKENQIVLSDGLSRSKLSLIPIIGKVDFLSKRKFWWLRWLKYTFLK